jgi:hypothetical protein
MNFNYIDSTIKTQAGHPFDWAKKIGAEVSKRYSVRFFCHVDADNAIFRTLSKIGLVNPCLRFDASFSASGSYGPARELAFYDRIKDDTMQLLDRLPGGEFYAFGTAHPAMLEAAALSGKSGVFSFIFHRDFKIHCSKRVIGETLFEKAFYLAHHSSIQAQVFSPEPELVRRFNDHGLSCSVKLLPYPILKKEFTTPPKERFTVGFLGAQRKYKGTIFIKNFCEATKSQNISILLHDSSYSSLFESDCNSHVQKIGYLNDIYNAIDRCHLIMLPYQPEIYSGHGSGILIDAIARGRPIITTAGSIPASRLQEDGSGLLLKVNSVEESVRLICSIARNYRDYLSMAVIARNRFLKFNTIAKTARALTAR